MENNFIKIPNLPMGDVAVAAASGTYPEFITRLQEIGIETVQTYPCERLSVPVRSHADMLCHHLGGNQIVVAKGEVLLAEKLRKLNFSVTESTKYLSCDYPNDILLNAARVGDYLFANKIVDDSILEYYEKNSTVKTKFIRQGYAKCSIAIIDCNSIITADRSIAEAASRLGLNVLQITPGYIKLEGYDYGFIGGCCGLIGKHKIAFTGNLHTHPDYYKIKSFIENRKVEIVSLTDGSLVDIGGIIPLKELV